MRRHVEVIKDWNPEDAEFWEKEEIDRAPQSHLVDLARTWAFGVLVWSIAATKLQLGSSTPPRSSSARCRCG